MRDFGQIPHHRHRVSPVGILCAQFGQRPGGIPFEHHVKKVEHAAPVGQSQHRANLVRAGFARAVGNRLVQQRRGIPRRAFCRASDQRQRIVGNLGPFGGGNLAQEADHDFGFNAAQVKTLAARQDRDGHLPDFRCGKDEFDVRGRFLERFEQRIERARGQHVYFVNDVDLVAGRGCAVVHAVDNLADVIDGRV